MPREFARSSRLNVQLQRELSELIREGLNDPRIGIVTVTAVSVSPDMRNARVMVSSLKPDADLNQTVKALNGAAGRLRGLLAKRLQLRAVPLLRFVADSALREGDRIGNLIRSAVAGNRAAPAPAPTPEDDDTDAG